MLKKYNAQHTWVNGRRYHKWGTNAYPGVTTVLSATKPSLDTHILDKWKAKVGEDEAARISQAACDRGTEVHACIEDYLIGKERICDPQWQPFWDSIRPALAHVSDVQLIEGALWHPSGFGGSVDCLGYWDGQLSIIDWKTSSKPKSENWIVDYKLQVAAYAAACNRVYAEDEIRVNRGVIVIALGDRPAQIFKIEPRELLDRWHEFEVRLRQYHNQNQLATVPPEQ